MNIQHQVFPIGVTGLFPKICLQKVWEALHIIRIGSEKHSLPNAEATLFFAEGCNTEAIQSAVFQNSLYYCDAAARVHLEKAYTGARH